jgi:hypothetical protein
MPTMIQTAKKIVIEWNNLKYYFIFSKRHLPLKTFLLAEKKSIWVIFKQNFGLFLEE